MPIPPRIRPAAALACLFLLLSAGAALADASSIYEYSARGIGLGSAVVARRPDPSTVAYNPAQITRLSGTQVQAGAIFMIPHGEIRTWDPQGNSRTTSIKSAFWTLPTAFLTTEISGPLAFGVGLFSRFGMGSEYPADWPGRFNTYKVQLQSSSVNPNLALAVTDQLSLAAGVELLYASLDMRRRILTPLGTEVDSNIDDADAFGLGFNLAGHFRFNDQWAVGLSYRSQVKLDAKGDVSFKNLGGLPDEIYNANFRDGSAKGSMTLPDSVSGGIAFTPVPELSIEAGATWTRWSTFRSLNIELPSPMPEAKNPREWKSVWRLNLGVEYQALDWLYLRAGYVYDQSPLTPRYADYFTQTNGLSIYSAGLGFAWDAWTLDIAYAYCDANSRSYRASVETGALTSKSRDGWTDMFGLSIGYAF